MLRSGRTVSPIHAVFDLDLDFRSEQLASGSGNTLPQAWVESWAAFVYLQSFIRLRDTVFGRTRSVRVENNSFLVGGGVRARLNFEMGSCFCCYRVSRATQLSYALNLECADSLCLDMYLLI